MRREGLDVELARAAESDRVSVLARGWSARDVPVDPDAETARRWATEELLDPVYHEQRSSLLSRLLEWLAELFDGPAHPRGVRAARGPRVVVVLVAVVVVAFLVAGPVRASRRGGRDRSVLADDDARTSAELRAAADAAAARGRLGRRPCSSGSGRSSASLEERTVLDERPARTAHEAAQAGGGPAAGARRGAASRPAGRSTTSRTATSRRAAQDEVRLRGLDARVQDARASTGVPRSPT